jgi:serine/threonine-protein kinase
MIRQTMFATLFGLAFAQIAQAADADADRLAVQARAFLKTYCHRCHSGEGSEGGVYDAVDYKSLVTGTDDEPAVVVPGKPGESRIWQMIEKNKMPPKSVRERPTAEEKEIVRKWIEAGAPAPPAEPPDQARRFISTPTMLAAIRDHLQKAREEDRPYLRYFTLTNLHNLPESIVPGSDLPVYRAALSKAINSLSWKPRIVLPEAVYTEPKQEGSRRGAEGAEIFVVDIRDLDWDRDALWQYIQAEYPFGLRYDTVRDGPTRLAYNEIVRLSGTLLPFVRADWFIATATRPPLYHDLVQIPRHARTLEHRLGVNVVENFERDRLARAGFAKSGVSGQNRLIERHEASYGAYWKSYDGKKDNPRFQLPVFPLGPAFRNHPFPDQAFEHDGGEIIFNLPNGLQGYMLVNAKDERIDVGNGEETGSGPILFGPLIALVPQRAGGTAG